jgi:hypothetical protein
LDRVLDVAVAEAPRRSEGNPVLADGADRRHHVSSIALIGSPMRAVALLLLSTLAGPAGAASVESGLTFQHGDWMLACDNTRTCRAAGYQADEGDNPPMSVLLTRQGGPRTAVSAELILGDYDDIKPPASMRLRINGRDLGRLGTDKGAISATLTPTQATALLKSLARDSQIVVEGDDKREWTLSDQGASAVLLKMDEFQGRLETPGALLRKGQRSEDAVPAALPAPRIKRVALAPAQPGDDVLAASPALRSALQASLKQEDACDDLSSTDAPQPLEVRRLSQDKLLVSTRCWLAAYNAGTGFWVVNDHAPYQPQLVTSDASDESEGEIGASQKGRGLGDCWSSESWTWDGTRYVQTSASTTGMCRLVTAGGAWAMPTLVTDVQP